MPDKLPVLYVDDEPDIRLIVEMALKLRPDFDVRTAASGDEALRIIGGGWHPALLTIDVMMPGLTGLDVLALLRASEETRHIPVAFVTARARPQDVSDYIAQGAVGVVTKPFDPMTLADKLLALVEYADHV